MDEHVDLCPCTECLGQPLWVTLGEGLVLVALLVAIPYIVAVLVP